MLMAGDVDVDVVAREILKTRHHVVYKIMSNNKRFSHTISIMDNIDQVFLNIVFVDNKFFIAHNCNIRDKGLNRKFLKGYSGIECNIELLNNTAERINLCIDDNGITRFKIPGTAGERMHKCFMRPEKELIHTLAKILRKLRSIGHKNLMYIINGDRAMQTDSLPKDLLYQVYYVENNVMNELEFDFVIDIKEYESNNTIAQLVFLPSYEDWDESRFMIIKGNNSKFCTNVSYKIFEGRGLQCSSYNFSNNSTNEDPEAVVISDGYSLYRPVFPIHNISNMSDIISNFKSMYDTHIKCMIDGISIGSNLDADMMCSLFYDDVYGDVDKI